MSRAAGLARRDVIALAVLVVLLAVLAYSLLPEVYTAREQARRMRCGNNLNQVAKGLATYLNEFGESRWYPWPLGRGTRPDDFNGAEWLAALYWTDVVPDPSIYLCPSTDDTNHDGHDLGTHKAVPGRFDWDTVSYAGLHYRSFTDADGNPQAYGSGGPSVMTGDLPAALPMACDDTQGPPHHPGGPNILLFDGHLFSDSHVDLSTQAELELEGLGEGRLPWPLRN